jgi:hypothetical protein
MNVEDNNYSTRVNKFIAWVENTPHSNLIGNSKIAFEAQVGILRQLKWYLENTDDYLNAAVDWSWEYHND